MSSQSKAMANAGAIIALATSNDSRYPPECTIDGNPDTYWITTGGYPQEVVVTLPTVTSLSNVSINCFQVRKLILEQADTDKPSRFKRIAEKTLTSIPNQHRQIEEFKFQVPIQVKYLKITIADGYDHFVSVYSISAN